MYRCLLLCKKNSFVARNLDLGLSVSQTSSRQVLKSLKKKTQQHVERALANRDLQTLYPKASWGDRLLFRLGSLIPIPGVRVLRLVDAASYVKPPSPASDLASAYVSRSRSAA